MAKDELLAAAWAAREFAHAPYSQFKVGAAILTSEGRIFTGCNVENASYGGTLCAERTAVVKAVSEGALAPGGLRRVVVATQTSKPCSPCGFCRQVIEEFARPDTRIDLSCQPGEIGASHTQQELLPFSFNADDL